MTEDTAREAADTATKQAQRLERFLNGEATAGDWADYGYDREPLDDDYYDIDYDDDANTIVAESFLEGYAVVHDYGEYRNVQYVVAVTGTGGPHTEIHAYHDGTVDGVGQDWGTPKVAQYAGNLPALADFLHTVFGGGDV